jgi:antitoxin YefM
MPAITATTARQRLFPLIEQVNADHAPVEIISRHGNAVLISAEDYESLRETAYLMSSPANARHLLESLRQAENGETVQVDLDDMLAKIQQP